MSTLTFMWQGVKVRVWDGYMGMKHVKNSGGGGCTDHGRGRATIDAAGDGARAVDGRVEEGFWWTSMWLWVVICSSNKQ